MGNAIVKGSMDELLDASKNGVPINLLRKSFDSEIIKGLKLVEGSMLARCSFANGGIYGSSFNGCTFVKCNFTGTDMYGLTFTNCAFNECSFSNAKFNMTKFDEKCIMNNCKFDGVMTADDTVIPGMDSNVVSEQVENIPALEELGFEFADGAYTLKADDGLTFISVCYDTEAECYREMIFANNEPIITIDLFDIEEYIKETMYRILKNGINSAFNKLPKSVFKEDENYDDIVSSLSTLVDKLMNNAGHKQIPDSRTDAYNATKSEPLYEPINK